MPVNIKNGELDNSYGGGRNAACFKLIPVNFKLREKRWPNTEDIVKENERMIVDPKQSAAILKHELFPTGGYSDRYYMKEYFC